MDIHAAVTEFYNQSKELLYRMQSPEGNMLTDTELHILRIQLRLLDKQSTLMQHMIIARKRPSPDQLEK